MDNLVQGLREELIQYGEMLTLLEEQQEMIVNRSADGLIQNLTAIHSQMAEIAKVRDKRDEQRHDLAIELEQDGDIAFRDLISFMPSEYQLDSGAVGRGKRASAKGEPADEAESFAVVSFPRFYAAVDSKFIPNSSGTDLRPERPSWCGFIPQRTTYETLI